MACGLLRVSGILTAARRSCYAFDFDHWWSQSGASPLLLHVLARVRPRALQGVPLPFVTDSAALKALVRARGSGARFGWLVDSCQK